MSKRIDLGIILISSVLVSSGYVRRMGRLPRPAEATVLFPWHSPSWQAPGTGQAPHPTFLSNPGRLRGRGRRPILLFSPILAGSGDGAGAPSYFS